MSKPKNVVATTENTATPKNATADITANFVNQLATELTIDTESFYDKITAKDGSTQEILHKEYELVNPVGKRNTISVYDLDTIESIEKIFMALRTAKVSSYAICRELYHLSDEKKLEKMGFKTIAEFGKATFGLETSTVNHYARIGKNFINDDYSIRAGLPKLSTSHFIELNAMVDEEGNIDDIIQLYIDGTLSDGMSTKKMREVIKTLKNGNTIEQKDESDTTSAKSDTTSAKSDTTSAKSDTIENVATLEQKFDLQVAIGQIVSKCSDIEQLFNIIGKNGFEVQGYGESLSTIKAIAKSLI